MGLDLLVPHWMESDWLAARPAERGRCAGKCIKLEMGAYVSLRIGGERYEHGGLWCCVGVHRDCTHPFLQSLLLCVQTVVVTMWFSWLCLGGPPMGSRTRKSSRQPRHSPPASSTMTLLEKVTTAPGLTVPHLRHWAPTSATGGASVPVSTGKMRWGWCLGEGRGANSGREEGAVRPGQADGPLHVPSPRALWPPLCGPPTPALPGC